MFNTLRLLLATAAIAPWCALAQVTESQPIAVINPEAAAIGTHALASDLCVLFEWACVAATELSFAATGNSSSPSESQPETSKPSPSPSPSPSSFLSPKSLQKSGDTSDSFATACLDAHNQARSSKGVQSLSWSDQVAATAQNFANKLANENRFEHSSSEERNGYGENLFKMSKGNANGPTAGRRAIQAWVDEREAYEAAGEPPLCEGVDLAKVGHWTQLMWRSSERLGCGVAFSDDSAIVVCHYDNAGNLCGEKAY
ncbi:hypothetical protein HK102_007144 [Quaeritorhiza haematococci]|nr:hypothetical protein HK102_007144 [Quaeritorhiza haematococci]